MHIYVYKFFVLKVPLFQQKIQIKMLYQVPFITQIYPFTVNDKGITNNILGQNVTFEFVNPPLIKDINNLKDLSISKINLINYKKRQINFLKEELKHERIKQHLETPKIQEIIKNLEK